MTCYFRFDHSYQAPTPSSFSANLTAMNVVPPSSSWFPDTTATNHFTSDLSNLHLHVARPGQLYTPGNPSAILHTETRDLPDPLIIRCLSLVLEISEKVKWNNNA
ncbi:hypothetical protein F2P56_026851 [Juglans regia]|uniref:Uncharacterized protein LOC109010384 n=2 Tax=Juglans regia TaxID=51240 RepID=A0A2I4GS79_JUGRE|nr:uncharacterized protein LOC109010384 [Juglans regia]KAF5451777.1 hypothetical protein F2P56_026851 [Juglans regia]